MTYLAQWNIEQIKEKIKEELPYSWANCLFNYAKVSESDRTSEEKLLKILDFLYQKFPKEMQRTISFQHTLQFPKATQWVIDHDNVLKFEFDANIKLNLLIKNSILTSYLLTKETTHNSHFLEMYLFSAPEKLYESEYREIFLKFLVNFPPKYAPRFFCTSVQVLIKDNCLTELEVILGKMDYKETDKLEFRRTIESTFIEALMAGKEELCHVIIKNGYDPNLHENFVGKILNSAGCTLEIVQSLESKYGFRNFSARDSNGVTPAGLAKKEDIYNYLAKKLYTKIPKFQEPFVCDYCGKKVKSFAYWESHSAFHHDKDNSEVFLLKLPSEIFKRIVVMLDFPSLGHITQTCRKIKKQMKDKGMWTDIFNLFDSIYNICVSCKRLYNESENHDRSCVYHPKPLLSEQSDGWSSDTAYHYCCDKPDPSRGCTPCSHVPTFVKSRQRKIPNMRLPEERYLKTDPKGACKVLVEDLMRNYDPEKCRYVHEGPKPRKKFTIPELKYLD